MAAPAHPPIRLVVTDDLRRSRLTVFFRLLLWAPHLVWWTLWTVLAWLVAIPSWLAALVTGRVPSPFARFLSAYVRYSVHQQSFLYLIGNPFPGFVGKPASYPVDLEIDIPAVQGRIAICFRPLVAVPALLLNCAAQLILLVAAFFGWFVSLVAGRMPAGLRNAGAWAVAYGGETSAYLFLLSGSYPNSNPLAISWRV